MIRFYRGGSRDSGLVKPLLLSLSAGMIGACGFQPIGAWPLAPLSIAVLLWLIGCAPHLRSALARGWWFGAGQFAIGLNWIATSFTYQANMPAWLGWVAVLLLACYLAVYPAVAAGFAWKCGRGGPIRLTAAFAAAWIVAEWLRATLFTGFAWNPLGVVLVSTPWAWWATVFGTYGLAALVVAMAGLLCVAVRRQWRRAAGLALLIAAATIPQISTGRSPVAFTPLALRIVQPNIGQDVKWQEGSEQRHLALLARLSRHDFRRPLLLLWPEAAVTLPMQDRRGDAYYRGRAAAQRKAATAMLGPKDLLLTGGITIGSVNGIDATSATNSIFALDSSGRILTRYDKNHLVPYGEYLPMRPLLAWLGLSRLAPGDLDFAPGPGPQSFDLPGVGRVGFQLCYEIIFSGRVVDRQRRPDFLFNPSNDAWFGAWGPPQHLAQARLRAIEEGLPVLRSTPTGISAVIDADGRLVRSLPWRKAGIIDAQLPAAKPVTPFARFGNVMPLTFALLLAIAAIAARRKNR